MRSVRFCFSSAKNTRFIFPGQDHNGNNALKSYCFISTTHSTSTLRFRFFPYIAHTQPPIFLLLLSDWLLQSDDKKKLAKFVIKSRVFYRTIALTVGHWVLYRLKKLWWRFPYFVGADHSIDICQDGLPWFWSWTPEAPFPGDNPCLSRVTHNDFKQTCPSTFCFSK